MADVRSLLQNARAARRIQHKLASYSTTGTLICLACHLQLKSESLWDGHLRSAGHNMRVRNLENESQSAKTSNTTTKKRKASEDDDGDDTLRKRSKPANGLPEGFFDPGMEKEPSPARHAVEMQIPSRPATPSKGIDTIPVVKPVEQQVDEDEWAAFEADIATAEAQVTAANDAVISAPAMSAEDIKKRTAEEEYTSRKEMQEAEIEGDKEDAQRKMEEELEEMESLEARVRKLRAKREQLRTNVAAPNVDQTVADTAMAESEEDDDDDDDDRWFR